MKVVWFTLAWVSFGLGAIGAFLPILPTAPFLILSAFLFSKSSPRFQAWVLGLPIAGQAITDWNERRIIRPRAKVLCASMLIVSLAIIWWHPEIHFYIKILMTLIIVSVGTFVVTRNNR